jgi:hypothetical protein
VVTRVLPASPALGRPLALGRRPPELSPTRPPSAPRPKRGARLLASGLDAPSAPGPCAARVRCPAALASATGPDTGVEPIPISEYTGTGQGWIY